jgi:hypothetical protein
LPSAGAMSTPFSTIISSAQSKTIRIDLRCGLGNLGQVLACVFWNVSK